MSDWISFMPTGSTWKGVKIIWKKPKRFSNIKPSNDKSQAKRNPEKWGDDSGSNVVYIKTCSSKRQAPEHNA
ncbi:hypothetical protein D3C85_1324130 [compost metagenome]